MAKVRQRCEAQPFGLCNEAEIVSGVVRDGERFKINIADAEVVVGFDLDRTVFDRIAAFYAFVPAVAVLALI